MMATRDVDQQKEDDFNDFCETLVCCIAVVTPFLLLIVGIFYE